MAVIFNIKCKSKEEMHELLEKVREGISMSCIANVESKETTPLAHINCGSTVVSFDGLSGSPECKDSEIFIADLQDDAFSLFVGRDNDHDIEFDIHSSDLLER